MNLQGCLRFHLYYVVLPTCLLTALVSEAKEGKTLDQSIERQRIDLEQIQREIELAKEKRKQLQQEQNQVLRTIEEMDQQLARERKGYEQINKALKQTDQELGDIGQQLEELRDQLRQGRDTVLAHMRHLYMEGRAGQLKALVTAKSLSNLQRRFDYLSFLTKREYDLITEYKRQVEEMEALQARQGQARDVLLKHRQATEAQLYKMQTIRKKKRVVLTSLKQSAATQDQALQALERREAQKDALLKELEQRRKLEEAKKLKPGVLPQVGSFLWPAEGEVVSRFGRQKHPSFDTYVFKKGIEIRASEGSSIRAVAPGKVVYADWLKGYGLVTIVDHGNGFFSFYAHASKLFVKEGETVTMGQTIGETGDSGFTEENVLYFELRKGTEPVDPLKWLVRRP